MTDSEDNDGVRSLNSTHTLDTVESSELETLQNDVGEIVKKFEEFNFFSARSAHKLYLSIECIDGLFRTIFKSRYIPKKSRTFLASIVGYQHCPESEKLIAILNTPISELPYIDKETRLEIIPIL